MIKQTIRLLFITFLIVSLQNCGATKLNESEAPLVPIAVDKTVTYQTHVQEIIYDRCVVCHHGSAPRGGLDLSSFENVKNAVKNGNVIQRMNNEDNPMPQNGILSAKLRKVMNDWVANGFPKN